MPEEKSITLGIPTLPASCPSPTKRKEKKARTAVAQALTQPAPMQVTPADAEKTSAPAAPSALDVLIGAVTDAAAPQSPPASVPVVVPPKQVVPPDPVPMDEAPPPPPVGDSFVDCEDFSADHFHMIVGRACEAAYAVRREANDLDDSSPEIERIEDEAFGVALSFIRNIPTHLHEAFADCITEWMSEAGINWPPTVPPFPMADLVQQLLRELRSRNLLIHPSPANRQVHFAAVSALLSDHAIHVPFHVRSAFFVFANDAIRKSIEAPSPCDI